MSVRQAEIAMAVAMAAFSIYLMWKSAELPIGWIEDEGPGGGAWPFWLSALMLVSCAGVAWNWLRRRSAPSRSLQPFVERRAAGTVLSTAALLTAAVFLFEIVGAYVALFLFMFVYIGFIGRRGLPAALVYAVATPVAVFMFFEILIKVILPKGVTDPLFYPIFRYFGMGGL